MSQMETIAVLAILLIANVIIFASTYDGDTDAGIFLAAVSTLIETSLIYSAFWVIEHIRFV